MANRLTVRNRQQYVSGVLYALPAAALVFGLLYYSIGYTAQVSFWQWNGISPTHQAIGLGNYLHLLQDPVFWQCIRNTAEFALTIPLTLGLGLFFAVAVHSRLHLRGIIKVIVFIPVVLSPAVMAPVFRGMFAPDGTINNLLTYCGLGGLAHPWLADPHTSLLALMTVSIWEWTGLSFLLYTAALSGIDQDILEAARLDGVGNWRMIGSFVIPLTRGTTASLLILSLIGLLKTFDIPYLVTSGGPVHSTEFLGTYLYTQSITNFKFGYGSAITIVIILLALVLAGVQLRGYRAAVS